MPSRTVICLQCQQYGRGRVEMTLLPGRSETATAWHFGCSKCGGVRIVTKDRIGGTVGQGARDDGVRSAYGRGYGRGSHPNAIT